MKQSKAYSYFSEYSQIAIGIGLASISLKAFLLPNGFMDGGVTGIALLVNQLLGINISYLLIIFSLPFLILGYYTVSKRIVVKSILSILGLALAIQFGDFEIITEDKLLISIFGGLFLGTGMGVAIRN